MDALVETTPSSDIVNTPALYDPVEKASRGRPKGTRAPRGLPVPVAEEEAGARSSRRRVKTTRYEFDFLDNEEQKLIQQAMKISKLETKRVVLDPPPAPVFHPTLEEFRDPVAYIDKIRAQAEPFGICKIVPPPEWQPECQIDMRNPKKFPTKLQRINRLQEGQGFDDGRWYTIEGYKAMADEFLAGWCRQHYPGEDRPSQEQLARDYWEMVETNSRQTAVEYGNDLDTATYMSGFIRRGQAPPSSENTPLSPVRPINAITPNTTVPVPAVEQASPSKVVFDLTESEQPEKAETVPKEEKASKLPWRYYARSGWNLHNIPSTRGSVLRYLQTPVKGINVPWLYIGMLFATFCWHNEDNYCYSISYNHFGASKQWYGVSGHQAAKMEEVMREFLLGSFRENPDLLSHLTTQVPVSLLMNNGVPVCKAVQDAGTFIVTFPKAYHCGFSYGFNCGEAVNFAAFDWLPFGVQCVQRYRMRARESVFSLTRLMFTLWENRQDMADQVKDLNHLCKCMVEAVEWELYYRGVAREAGMKDLGNSVELPANDFTIVNMKGADYDDTRCCASCKQACVFSCVVCKCSNVLVACINDHTVRCKCPITDKCLLSWNSDTYLKKVRDEAKLQLFALKDHPLLR